MFKESDVAFSFETDILGAGAYIREPHDNPEIPGIFMTSAFNVEDLDALEARYATKGFCYNRYRNPNRATLCELVTYLEHGEQSISCSSGMGAISTALITLVKAGDHILADRVMYSETKEALEDILAKFGVETSFIDFTNLEEAKAAIRPNTTVFYMETVSNPLITVPDIRALADLAHANGAKMVVDNTFMTGYLFRPLDFGADVVVNSLTKFANGHSDTVCGAITGTKEFAMKCHHTQVLLGTQADPFSAWLTQRGIRTIALRVQRQSDNACALAAALEKSPYVKKVHHPSLESAPQHELAHKQFGNNYGGMLSIELEDNRQKMNKFMRSLHFAHYAMTLGGYRTSLAYPVLSSHGSLTEEERQAIGITHGLLRISCGIEDTQDLVKDFLDALEAAYGEDK